MKVGMIRKNKIQRFGIIKNQLILEICNDKLNEYTLCQLIALTKGGFKRKLREMAVMKQSPLRTWTLVDAICWNEQEKIDCLRKYADNL